MQAAVGLLTVFLSLVLQEQFTGNMAGVVADGVATGYQEIAQGRVAFLKRFLLRMELLTGCAIMYIAALVPQVIQALFYSRIDTMRPQAHCQAPVMSVPEVR